VRQLDELFPDLREEGPAPGPTSTIATPVERLDLATVIQVSQAVSGEMVLEKLINMLMRTAIAQAGAERGLLILSRGAEPRIEAEATTSNETVSVQLRDEPVTAAALPDSVLHYVLRARETVILDDAANRSPFADDPYIRERKAHSILCLPLINQAKLIGVLYLENNLAPRAFAPARIAVLKLLASQAAISLENARLYRDIEQREAKIRRLVEANIIGIFIWDFEGPILEANDAFLRMVGYDRNDLIAGRLHRTDLTPPEWRDRTARALGELKMTGTIQPYEKEFFRKDGSRVPVLLGAVGFDETANQGVTFALDLTERKRADEALRRSETYLAEAQRLTHTGSWAYDPAADRTIYWSEELFRIFGLDPQRGSSPPDDREIFRLVHPEDRERFSDLVAEALRNKADYAADYRIVLPDRTVRHIHTIGRPVLNETGVVIERVGTAVDVTERKRAEEELRASEARFRTFVDHATDAFMLHGEDGTVLDVNRHACESLGYSRDELIGMAVANFDPDANAAFLQTILERLDVGEILTFERRHRRKDGTVFPVEVRVREFRKAGRRLVLSLTRDITERKRAEAEARGSERRYREMQTELAHANRVATMGLLTASIAHEVNQPIAAARNNAAAGLRFLSRNPPDLEEVRDALECIVNDADRGGEIIGRICALVKKASPQKDRLAINGAILEVATRRGPAGHRRRPGATAAGDPQLGRQRYRGDERNERSAPRIAAQHREGRAGRRAGRGAGFGSGAGAGESRAPLRGLLHDQSEGHGDGVVDLSLDHRSAWRTAVGGRERAPRGHLPICCACPPPRDLSLWPWSVIVIVAGPLRSR
jgi:PAS domain S-box-containing protein